MSGQGRQRTSSLRSKLLIITVLFMMLVETVIYLPAIATFRETYLNQTIKAAQLAALSLEASPDRRISSDLETSLLTSAGVVSVIMMRNEESRMLGFEQMPADVNVTYDLRDASLWSLIMGAFDVFMGKGQRFANVIGTPVLDNTRWIEITIQESELYAAMTAHSSNLFFLSILISLSTGLLVYLTLHWIVVRPLYRLTTEIATYRQEPDNPDQVVKDTIRRDEIGVIQRELRTSQLEIQQSFNQKKRLANLGAAVSKINHDLRGMLTTASLASTSLARLQDPKTIRITARLERALTRAIDLCTRTLNYGSANEPAPKAVSIPLSDVMKEVTDSLPLDPDKVTISCSFDGDFRLFVDPDQFFRVLYNLMKNSLEAMNFSGEITIGAAHTDDQVKITVTDTGPGISESAKETLFQAFQSSRKQAGGTGLGLAIAHEIVVAHGGSIELVSSTSEGSTFLISLPLQPDL